MAAAPGTKRPSLARSAVVYGVSNAIERAIPALLLLVLTHYLTRADFGHLAIFTALVGIASPLVGMNVAYAVRRRYFDAAEIDFRRYVGNTVLIVVAGTAVGCVAVSAWWGVFGAIAGLGLVWLLVAVVSAGANTFISIPLTLWQVEHQPVRYGAVQIGRAVMTTAATAALVIGAGMSWQGAALAAAASAVLFAVVCVPASRQWLDLRPDAAHLRHALGYGGGLIIHALGTLAITSADRFFIDHYAGAAETGVYFIAYQFGFVVIMAADAFNRAWSPWLYEGLKRNSAETNRRIVRGVYLFNLGIIGFAVLVALASPLIIRGLLGDRFAGAERFVWWIAIGFAFNGMYRVVAGFVFYSGRTMILSWITGTAALLNICLNAVLVPRSGALGAAQATAAAFATSFVLTAVAARYVHGNGKSG